MVSYLLVKQNHHSKKQTYMYGYPGYDLEFDLLRSSKVKVKVTNQKPRYDFLYAGNTNQTSNSYHFQVIWLQKNIDL